MSTLKSFHHLYNAALLRRFLGSNDELYQIQMKLEQTLAGIKGEERVLREIQDALLNTDFILLSNLQFTNDLGFSHQIDFLVLTTQFILLIEAKNISGTLYYNKKLRQFSRMRFDGTREHFQNPFDQLKRHHEFLHYLLKNANYQIPIIPLIINASPNSALDTSLQDEPIINVSSFRAAINKWQKQYRVIVTFETINKLKLFLENRVVFHETNRYITSNLIRKGVLCPACNFRSVMHFESRTWRCSTCNKNNRGALKLALRDYRILIGKTITNKEFRNWTGLENVVTASKLLRNFNFPYEGANRNRIYTIPQDYLFIDLP